MRMSILDSKKPSHYPEVIRCSPTDKVSGRQTMRGMWCLVCEVSTKCALLSYTIVQDNPFNVGQVIEDAILFNKDAKMNLRHPFVIYGLCKKSKVPLASDEAWIHPIKSIVVKKNKSSVPRP